MASGKQIGEYSLKFTSLTLTPGPASSVLVQGNCEGPVTGFPDRNEALDGTVLGTATFVGVGKNGTYSWCSQGYMEDGQVTTGGGSGSYESVGKHRWHTQGVVQISDVGAAGGYVGQTVATEGEIDLAARSWTGKIFEKI